MSDTEKLLKEILEVLQFRIKAFSAENKEQEAGTIYIDILKIKKIMSEYGYDI